MTTQLEKLKDLFIKMDSIEGTTEGGRHFRMDTTGDILNAQIIHNNEAFEPAVRITDIIGKNILSNINKIDSSFFDSRHISSMVRTKRKVVELTGNKEGEKFTVLVSISNNWTRATFHYRDTSNSLSFKTQIP
ncbi:unnamed protein product, partial [marine sediment metagenome]